MFQLVRLKCLFMKVMAVVYMFAFASLYTQIPGLYGPSGLTPVHNVLLNLKGKQSLISRLLSFPSLVIYSGDLNIQPHHAMDICCLYGIAFSLLAMVFDAMRNALTFFVLWSLYLSLYKVGQVFLWFQWDILLLEAGFLCILIAPMSPMFQKSQNNDGLKFWLARWLLFRLMFASGIVKLSSECPTWWGLTALNYHFESQCIPTPLSWYAHQLPEWMLKLGVVGTYFIEILVPLLFFVPFRSLRIFSFFCQVLLQICIIMTGNYNFFNLLTIVLCFSLLDEKIWGKGRRCHSCWLSTCSWHSLMVSLSTLALSGFLIAVTVYFCNVYVDWHSWSASSRLSLSFEAYNHAVKVAVPLIALYCGLSLIIEVLYAFYCSIMEQGNKFWKMMSFLQTGIVSYIVAAMFALSLVSFGVLDGAFYHSIPAEIRAVHRKLDPYAITNSYGLFRRMTGVGGRPELIIEGSNNGIQWSQYEFLYKPGDVHSTPVYVAPHQPRLDWQMWFAALGRYESNPWLVNLVYKLLIGDKEVLKLLKSSPFAEPPRLIRVQRYHYHYTSYDHNKGLLNQTSKWWQREFKSEYLFPLSKEDKDLKEYLINNDFLPIPNHTDSTILSSIRAYSEVFTPPKLLWALLFCGVAASATMSLFRT